MSLFVVTRFSGSGCAASPFLRSRVAAARRNPLKRVTTNKSAKRAAQKVLHNKRLFECHVSSPSAHFRRSTFAPRTHTPPNRILYALSVLVKHGCPFLPTFLNGVQTRA